MTGPGPAVKGADALVDDVLAAVEHLTGPGSGTLVEAAVAATGATLLAAEVDAVSHEPGVRCTVTYAATVDRGHGPLEETYVAMSSVGGPPEGAAVLEADGLSVGMWRYPFDPVLPGLVDAVYPERVEARFGGVVGTVRGLEVVAYRPGRRAVVRVDGDRGAAWLKVLRPSRVARTAAVHEAFAGAGVPVPEVRDARPDEGLLLLAPAGVGGPGVPASPTLRQRFLSGAAPGSPAVADLAPLVSAVAGADLGPTPARRRPLADAAPHVGLLRCVLPEEAERVTALHAALAPEVPGEDAAIGAGATVHGDLHDGQLVASADGGVVGLIDLDDAGVGAVADDLGNLVGHGAVLAVALGHGGKAEDAERVAAWLSSSEALSRAVGVGHDEVVRRAAAVGLSLAAGPYRSREPGWREAVVARIDLVQRLVGDLQRSGWRPTGA